MENIGIEIEYLDQDAFGKLWETLSRIGLLSGDGKTLVQSCHVLFRGGKYYIAHFKELFVLDKRETTIDGDDYARRNAIASMLQRWGLIQVVNQDDLDAPLPNFNRIKVVKHSEKDKYILKTKFTFKNSRPK